GTRHAAGLGRRPLLRALAAPPRPGRDAGPRPRLVPVARLGRPAPPASARARRRSPPRRRPRGRRARGRPRRRHDADAGAGPRARARGRDLGQRDEEVAGMATTEDQSVAVAEVLADWRERGIRNVRFELPDMHGTSRSKLVPIEHADRYAREGLNMYGGTVVLDSRSDVVPGTLYNEEIAYADLRLKPDASTAAVVPWLEATGRMICDTFWDDGRPLEAAPRHVFRRVLDRCHELGYEPLLGTEPEFYLLDRETRQPLLSGYHIVTPVRNTWTPLVERIVQDMRAFGVDI